MGDIRWMIVLACVFCGISCSTKDSHEERIAAPQAEGESVTIYGEQAAENREPLKANDVLEFVFDELPNTMYGKLKGKRVSPRLLASLPGNYTADAQFPLLVHLAGNHGGEITRNCCSKVVV